MAVRLPCMIAADFCAVNRAVFVPQSPFRGDVGKFFCTKFRDIFCANRCVWGAIGGHISLAYPGRYRAQEIPNAQARAGIPCRAGAQAQRKPSTARAASPPPASRPQEIPNARAREDTTTRRPARNSKRARARYWRRGSRPLRVRKPKIFLGKGSKNRLSLIHI